MSKTPPKLGTVIRSRPAGSQHQVLTVESTGTRYRRQPCGGCPWRRDRAGDFPAEAFRHSASTCYDAAMLTFGCHESGARRPAICAGFLLRNAEHNLLVRLAVARGTLDLAAVSDGGLDLFESYREMAIANGVAPEDPALAACRGNGGD